MKCGRQRAGGVVLPAGCVAPPDASSGSKRRASRNTGAISSMYITQPK